MKKYQETAGLRTRLAPLDVLIFCVGLAAVVAAFVSAGTGIDGTRRARIRGDGGEWVYDLGADAQVPVAGPLGVTTVVVDGGKVWVNDSPCINQVCVRTGHVHLAGAWVACLPNKVFVVIEGTREDIDAQTF